VKEASLPHDPQMSNHAYAPKARHFVKHDNDFDVFPLPNESDLLELLIVYKNAQAIILIRKVKGGMK